MILCNNKFFVWWKLNLCFENNGNCKKLDGVILVWKCKYFKDYKFINE